MRQILWLGNNVSFLTQRSQWIIQRGRGYTNMPSGGFIGRHASCVLVHSGALVTPDSSSPLLGIKHSTWPTRHVTRKNIKNLFVSLSAKCSWGGCGTECCRICRTGLDWRWTVSGFHMACDIIPTAQEQAVWFIHVCIYVHFNDTRNYIFALKVNTTC